MTIVANLYDVVYMTKSSSDLQYLEALQFLQFFYPFKSSFEIFCVVHFVFEQLTASVWRFDVCKYPFYWLHYASTSKTVFETFKSLIDTDISSNTIQNCIVTLYMYERKRYKMCLRGNICHFIKLKCISHTFIMFPFIYTIYT